MKSLTRPRGFFDACRGPALFAGPLAAPQVAGLNALTAAMGSADWNVAWAAYGLATAFHETGRTMQPVRERGIGDKNHNGEDDWFEKYDVGELAGRLGNTPGFDGDGQRWCGRGYPQVTGYDNYFRADKALHARGLLAPELSVIATPALMLHAEVAAPVMVLGMEEGWFTGKKLADYLPMLGDELAFTHARKIINGQDQAAKIAGYAMAFQPALLAGAWA